MMMKIENKNFEIRPIVIESNQMIRFFDVLVATSLFIITLPITLTIIILIKLDDFGRILFIQERLGHEKKCIKIIKFRSMIEDAEKDGAKWAAENDTRVTRVGKMLRKSRLDELPQLLNVIKGDMSMIGPRPIREEFANHLAAYHTDYDKRFLVKPGLTGWAQIYAGYGSTIGEQLEKIPYDQKYLDGLSLRSYFTILLLTIRVVLIGKGR